MERKIRNVAFVVFAAMSAIALSQVMMWAVATMTMRPLDGVEGELLFEAARLREKRALYIDPWVGDLSYGPPATRYWVLYPPLFSALVSRVPLASVAAGTVFIRALSLVAWTLAVLVLAKPGFSRAKKAERAFVVAAAAFVLGTYALMLYGAAGRPDSLALLLAALALARATKRGKVDALCGVLFAVAAFVKPNVIGLGAGALLASLVRHRKRGIGGALGLVGAAIGIACILHVASGGLYLSHLLASTAQPANASLWAEQMASRLPFFLFPLSLAAVVAWKNKKNDATFLALGALVVSFAWAIVSLAKIGSASNYWMEPCLAALAITARAPSLDLGKWGTTAALVGLAVQAPYDGIASVKSSREGLHDAPEQRAALDAIRTRCVGAASDWAAGAASVGATQRVVVAEEPGLEMEIDGRVISTPFQFASFARRTRAFEALWQKDLTAPEVSCLVLQGDALEHLDRPDDPRHDRFTIPLKKAFAEHFALAEKRAGLYIYTAK